MIRYNPKGLTTPQIDESRRRHGDNVITPPKDDSAWRLLLEKFRDPIIRILLLAAVLSLIIGFVHKDFTESVGIICAIILATCVGFWFEWDAQRRFRRLNQVNDDIPVKVMREGSIREIPRRDVISLYPVNYGRLRSLMEQMYFLTRLRSISHCPPSPSGADKRKEIRRPCVGSSSVSRMLSRK